MVKDCRHRKYVNDDNNNNNKYKVKRRIHDDDLEA